MSTPGCPAQLAAKILPYVLAADWSGHMYCHHNNLPPVINSHYITRLTNMFFWQLFCFKRRSKLSCCCNILDCATIRTSYNNRIPIVGGMCMCDTPIVEGGDCLQ